MGGPWEDYSKDTKGATGAPAEEVGPWNDFGGGTPVAEEVQTPMMTEAERKKAQEEWIKKEGTIGTRLRNTTVKDVAMQVPRMAQEFVTVPLSSAKKAAYGLGALAKYGAEVYRGRDLPPEERRDRALEAGTEVMKGYTPVEGPMAPSALGEAIGYGAESVNKALPENVYGDIGRGALEAGMDIAGLVGGGKGLVKAGAATGRGLATVGKAGVRAVTTPETATDLYRSAMKPTTTPSKQLQVQQAIERGLETETPINRKGSGLEKTVERIENKEAELQGILDPSTKRINIGALDKSLDPVREAAFDDIVNRDTIHSAANEYVQAMREHPSYDAATDSVPIQTANVIKRQLYKTLRKSAAFDQGQMPAGKITAAKGTARSIMQAIEEASPELGPLNKELGKDLNLQKHLERAVSRIQNTDVVGMRTKLAMLAGLAAPKYAFISIASAVLDNPGFKSRLAIALHKIHKGKLSTAETARIIDDLPNRLAQQPEEAPQGQLSPEAAPTTNPLSEAGFKEVANPEKTQMWRMDHGTDLKGPEPFEPSRGGWTGDQIEIPEGKRFSPSKTETFHGVTTPAEDWVGKGSKIKQILEEDYFAPINEQKWSVGRPIKGSKMVEITHSELKKLMEETGMESKELNKYLTDQGVTHLRINNMMTDMGEVTPSREIVQLVPNKTKIRGRAGLYGAGAIGLNLMGNKKED